VTTPTFDVLLPTDRAGQRLAPDPAEDALTELYAHPDPAPGRPAYVRANMVSTLDGSAAGRDGRSGSINDAADHRAFEVQRSVADVVLVGAGTARAEGYRELSVAQPLRAARARRGQGEQLALALVSRTGDLPGDLLHAPSAPLVVTVASSPGLAALRDSVGPERVLVAGERDVDPARALALLAGRGLVRVLAEGGPRLLADLLAAGQVDELCLTTSPLVVAGPGPRIVTASGWLDPARSRTLARPAHLLHSDGVLLGRWVLHPDDGARPAH
jgi:riboflavin biosynthesis pyrimidine reductase